MGLTIKPQEETVYVGEKAIIEAGSYPARCIRIIDLGTQETEWKGVTKDSHKVKFVFEFPDEKAVFNQEEGEQPFILSKTYTASFNSKASLYKDLCSWMKQDVKKLESFKLSDLLDKECLISVTHSVSDKRKDYLYEKCKENGVDTSTIHPSQYTYANIAGIMPVPKGMSVSPANNEQYVLDFDNFDQAVYEKLSEWDQEKVDQSKERKSSTKPAKTAAPAGGAATPEEGVTEKDLDEMFS